MFGFGKKARRRREAEDLQKMTAGGCYAIAQLSADHPEFWGRFAEAVENMMKVAEKHLANCKADTDKERLFAELINLSDRATDKANEMAMGIVAMQILASTMRDEEAGENAFYLAGAVINDALQFIEDGTVPSARIAAL